MKKPFINATFAALYIVAIVLVTSTVTSILKTQNDTIIIPMAMLSLFVLSAAVMGYLFLSEPLYLLMEKRKQDAIIFFTKIAGFFACYVVVFAIIMVAVTNSGENISSSFKDATYIVAGQSITLSDGVNEKDIPDSSSKIVTKYFGNEIYKDLNDDGRDDVIFMLTQETGGSGIFYYVTASINTDKGYKGTEAIYIGDRIAPQNIISGEGKQVIVNYADRASTEDFSVKPSFGKSLYLILDPVKNMFGEVVQNFEGESR